MTFRRGMTKHAKLCDLRAGSEGSVRIWVRSGARLAGATTGPAWTDQAGLLIRARLMQQGRALWQRQVMGSTLTKRRV